MDLLPIYSMGDSNIIQLRHYVLYVADYSKHQNETDSSPALKEFVLVRETSNHHDVTSLTAGIEAC